MFQFDQGFGYALWCIHEIEETRNGRLCRMSTRAQTVTIVEAICTETMKLPEGVKPCIRNIYFLSRLPSILVTFSSCAFFQSQCMPVLVLLHQTLEAALLLWTPVSLHAWNWKLISGDTTF